MGDVGYGAKASVGKVMSNSSPHWLVPDGWTRSVVIEGLHETYRLLWYENGQVRFEHPCKAGDGSDCINAPSISKHEITEADGRVTVSPSILCLGCNTHGFVRENRWVAA